MDKSGANKAAMDAINKDRGEPIEVRQIKYLSNIVEQDHRATKRITKQCRDSNHSGQPRLCWPELS